MYDAKILKDSLSPDGVRLTTFEVTLPRIVLAEFNTHRVFSRNSASSRAIPVKKNIKMVREDPFIPETFAQNKKGMQGDDPLAGWKTLAAKAVWHGAKWAAIGSASLLERLELHKALANRILEPFKWHTIIVTATEWDNFWALRTDPNAQYEIRKPAQMMKALYDASDPWPLQYGDWHLPLVGVEDHLSRLGDWDYWKKVSVGRCARVSYLTHDGRRDPDKDVQLHDMLKSNGHLSPFEHVATPLCSNRDHAIDNYLGALHVGHEAPHGEWSGNFRGWHQYRKDIPNEANFGLAEKG
jgi:thymidylate synthase ThyX